MKQRNKILTVVGARPQFVKAAVVSKAFAALENENSVQELIIHTGQHFDHEMSENFFRQLQLPDPILNLGIHDQKRSEMVGRMISALDEQIKKICPKVVLVYGDTDSTVAATLAASYNNVPVAHVEAGPRGGIKSQTEEMNRVLVDHLATINFCPTEHTAANLSAENITEDTYVVGDVMLDAFNIFSSRGIAPAMEKPFVLATLHRRENTDDEARLRSVMDAMSKFGISILFPAHPRTMARIEDFNIPIPSNVQLIGPISYFESLGALEACEFIITDSGGLPKEAFFSGKRSLILNDFASWPELIDLGVSRLTGISTMDILEAVPWARQGASSKGANPFGDGHSGEKIVEILNTFVNGNDFN